MEIEESESVVRRFMNAVTLSGYPDVTDEALASDYGKVMVNDVMFDPYLMQVLGPLMAPLLRGSGQTSSEATL